MELGSWLTAHRTANNYSLRTLANTINIEFNTLWRLEKGEGQPTLRTVYSICRGLQISLDQMLLELDGTKEVQPTNITSVVVPQAEQNRRYLTAEEISSFLVSNEFAVKVARKLLNVLTASIPSLGTEYKFPTFEAAPFPVFEVRLRSPYPIDSDRVPTLVQFNRSFLLKEIGEIIRLRRTKGIQKDLYESLSGENRNGQLEIPTSTLSRIETGITENIKFNDALMINKVYGVQNDILRMYWNAPELYDRRSFIGSLDYAGLLLDAAFFVFMDRWLAEYSPIDNWPIQLMRDLQ